MKLSDLTPESAAEATLRAVSDHIWRLALACGYNLVDAGPSDLRFTVRALTVYAQTGLPPDDAPASEYYVSLLPLYDMIGDPQSTVPDLAEDADPSTPWGLVLRACVIRDKLTAGDDVTLAELGLLASISRQGVSQLVAAGEIKTRKHRDDSRPGAPRALVTATEARRWLSGRGVPGF